jgi:hypothetical protein
MAIAAGVDDGEQGAGRALVRQQHPALVVAPPHHDRVGERVRALDVGRVEQVHHPARPRRARLLGRGHRDQGGADLAHDLVADLPVRRAGVHIEHRVGAVGVQADEPPATGEVEPGRVGGDRTSDRQGRRPVAAGGTDRDRVQGGPVLAPARGDKRVADEQQLRGAGGRPDREPDGAGDVAGGGIADLDGAVAAVGGEAGEGAGAGDGGHEQAGQDATPDLPPGAHVEPDHLGAHLDTGRAVEHGRVAPGRDEKQWAGRHGAHLVAGQAAEQRAVLGHQQGDAGVVDVVEPGRVDVAQHDRHQATATVGRDGVLRRVGGRDLPPRGTGLEVPPGQRLRPGIAHGDVGRAERESGQTRLPRPQWRDQMRRAGRGPADPEHDQQRDQTGAQRA